MEKSFANSLRKKIATLARITYNPTVPVICSENNFRNISQIINNRSGVRNMAAKKKAKKKAGKKK